MASEYDHTDQQDSTDSGSTADTSAPEGSERVDPAPEQSAAPSIDPAAETDAAPAPRTRTRKTAAKTAKAATRKATTPRASRAAKAADGAPDADPDADPATSTSSTTKAAKATKATRTTKKAAAKKTVAPAHEPAEGSTTLSDASDAPDAPEASEAPEVATAPVTETPAPAKRARRRSARPAEEPTTDARSLIDEEALRFDRLESAAVVPPDEDDETDETDETDDQQVVTADAGASDDSTDAAVTAAGDEAAPGAYGPLFQAPTAPSRRRRRASAPSAAPDVSAQSPADQGPGDQPEAGSDPQTEPDDTSSETSETGEDGEATEAPRRRRRRGGKGRRGRSSGGGSAAESSEPTDNADAAEAKPADEGRDTDTGGRGTPAADSAEDDGGSSSSRRRTRRRRRSGGSDGEEDQPGVTTKVRESRRDEVTALKGSTRLEAKKQRRREGREAGRRRTIITEAEFLARRESVDRVMVVRHVGDRTQIGVLEDGVLVEHYISKETSVSMAGNIYLGRVQNVLPSMEAAFVDIGKGRNAVLYAGEVNWDAAGLEANQPKRIENALTSGESVLVQVTKDPIGHKGARLTSQISLPGRYLVYVPNSSMTGISRKLPETERARLKKILKEVVPDTAGVIVRTAAEGASEEELRADVERLTTTWADITAKAEAATGGGGKKKNKGGGAPLLLHGEPDLTVRVIRDIFNEDFAKLVVAGDQAWQEVSEYVTSVAPDLADRITKWTSEDDLFTQYRVDEQIAKAMDRKVWLPSRRLAGHRPDRGDDRRRRQHRQVHRLGRQPRGDGHQEQHRGRRGDRPPAPAARRRRDHRHRLHRHGPRVQPRPRRPPPPRVPRPRPHEAPGRRGDLARPGPDDPQAGRFRPHRGLLRDLRGLWRARHHRPQRPGRQERQRSRPRRQRQQQQRRVRPDAGVERPQPRTLSDSRAAGTATPRRAVARADRRRGARGRHEVERVCR